MPEVYSKSIAVGRENSFNALRLFFAVLVLIEHAALTSGHYFNFSVGILRLGSLGVFGFFAVSGFLITPGLLRGGFTKYILRRSARIFPAFWFVSLFTSLVFAKIWLSWSKNEVHLSLLANVNYLFHNIIFLPSSPESSSAGWNLLQTLPLGVPRSGVVNESIWTLPLEFTCYVALGILVITFRKFLPYRIKYSIAAILIIFWLASIYSAFRISSFWEVDPTIFTTIFGKWPYILSFFIGSVLSLQSNHIFKSKYSFSMIPLLLIAYFSSFHTITWAIFGSAAFATGTVLLGKSKICAKFSTKTDISYGVYLYHWPVQQTLVHYLDKNGNVLLFIIISLIISGFLAYLSAKLIEEPAIDWARARK